MLFHDKNKIFVLGLGLPKCDKCKLIRLINNLKFFEQVKAQLVIAIVWLYGSLTQLIPIVLTSGVINTNSCVKSLIWPNKMLSDAYAMIVLILQYFLPLAILIFTYCKLILFIRNKHRVTISSVQYNNQQSLDTRSHDPHPQQSDLGNTDNDTHRYRQYLDVRYLGNYSHHQLSGKSSSYYRSHHQHHNTLSLEHNLCQQNHNPHHQALIYSQSLDKCHRHCVHMTVTR